MSNVVTLDRIKTVIRICLQLDQATPISDDMPLMEGEHDIDSLDVLSIITELEREFEIDIADGEMAKTDLSTVGALGAFIDELYSAPSSKKL